jgi:hypothetical protein
MALLNALVIACIVVGAETADAASYSTISVGQRLADGPLYRAFVPIPIVNAASPALPPSWIEHVQLWMSRRKRGEQSCSTSPSTTA